MNGKAHIHFKNGTKIAKADKVTYLGVTITSDSSRHAEIVYIMSIALATCQKFTICWRKTNANVAWNMQVYSAVSISQLVFRLSTLNMTPGINNIFDAFHMRGLRHMLEIDHSY